jgi:mannosyltransferase OCH1-like enzyme
MAYWQNTWKTHHPSFSYELWDDAQNRLFVASHFDWFLSTYDSYDKEIKRADAIRYMYLYTYGGIYADMDFECLKSLEPLLTQKAQSYDILLGSMKTTWSQRNHAIPNAILISKPHQDFWLVLLRNMESAARRNPHGGVEELTGPVILAKTYWTYWTGSSRICILPAQTFYPLSWNLANHERQRSLHQSRNNPRELTLHMQEKYPDSFAITYWTHSW